MITALQLLMSAALSVSAQGGPMGETASTVVAQSDEATEAHPMDHASGGDVPYMQRVLDEGEYDAADVVTQPGAQPGDLVMCPVSGNAFMVDDDHPHAEYEGQEVYFCCPSCIRRFMRDPEAFLSL